MGLIKSISHNQDQILKWISRLHLPRDCNGTFDLDPTYSKGGFYREIPKPKICCDLSPAPFFPAVGGVDVRALPLKSESVRSIIFDPPFLCGGGVNGLMAVKLGFYPKDLFILLSKTRPKAWNHKSQNHARKFHSYFWVFGKQKRSIGYFLDPEKSLARESRDRRKEDRDTNVQKEKA